jgi:ESF2/ABP1 family protein
MSSAKTAFLAHASSDSSDNESGYDSEAAEISRTTTRKRGGIEQPTKRRKITHDSDPDDEASDRVSGDDETGESGLTRPTTTLPTSHENRESGITSSGEEDNSKQSRKKTTNSDDPRDHKRTKLQAESLHANLPTILNGPSELPTSDATKRKPKKSKSTKPLRPGVIYLSSLPPYLRPSALRNLLSARGFTPITRLFLAPINPKPGSSSTSTTTTKKNTRQLYAEGWLEFPSHKTARRCAETLNATPVGGKKGGYYRDDLWNMKYLKGMGWAELMSGVRGERREEEARRDEARRDIVREQKEFVRGVERGRVWEGMKRKGKAKGKRDRDELGSHGGADGDVGREEVQEEPRRTFRQFEARKERGPAQRDGGVEVQEILGKIF